MDGLEPGRQRAARQLTAERVIEALEELRVAAMEAKGWAPALRALELQGRHIGMWRSDEVPGVSLLELLAGNADKDG